jgi:hypothetical protein
MNTIPAEFAPFIATHDILARRSDAHIVQVKARIVFVDDSLLVYTDIAILTEERRKYSFQWMNSDGTLRIRWDNAPHYPHIATYPHHQHIGDETSVQDSPEMTLDDVLAVITATLERQNIV